MVPLDVTYASEQRCEMGRWIDGAWEPHDFDLQEELMDRLHDAGVRGFSVGFGSDPESPEVTVPDPEDPVVVEVLRPYTDRISVRGGTFRYLGPPPTET